MKHDNLYELRFSGLKLGIHTFDWHVDTSFLLDRDVELFSNASVNVSLELVKKERLMHLYFSLEGTLTTQCDRCGESMIKTLAQKNELVVRFATETDLSDDEVIFVDESANHLDLDQFIYEFIMVGLPSRIVHPEGGCDPDVEKYLEEEIEEEKEDITDAVDPRWEALKKLK